MALETATYIYGLVTTNPDGGDSRTTGDNHLRLIKSALKRTFPNLDGEMSASHSILNTVAFVGLRTNAAATVSATHDVAVPRVLANGVAYPLNPVFAFMVGASATVSPWRDGWSATYAGSGGYRVYHPVGKSPASSLGVMLTPMSVQRRVSHYATNQSSYIEYRIDDGTSVTVGGVQLMMMVI